MKKVVVTILLIGFMISLIHAFFEDIGSSRVIAMGGSLVSVPGHSEMTQINPALVWYMNGHSIYLSYNKEYTGLQNDSFNHLFISYGTRFGKYLGIGVYDSFFTTDYYQENTLGFAIAREISKYISIGITTNIYSKMYKKNEFTDPDPYIIENGSSKVGFGLDIGTLFIPVENFHIGFVLKNINSPSIAIGDLEDRVPRSMIIGTSYNYIHSESFSIRPTFDFEYVLENINGSNQILYHLGCESWFMGEGISARGGFSKNTLSFGTGMDLRNLGANMGGFNIIFDYTFLIHPGPISGLTHHIGLTFDIDGNEEL